MTTFAANPSFVVVAPGGEAGGFSPAECDRALALAAGLGSEAAKVGGARSAEGHADRAVRRAALQRVPHTEHTAWLFERVINLAVAVNRTLWDFDLDGEVEQVQIVRYCSGDHYGWHTDWGASGETSRKVSVTVQLTDPATYNGGELELHAHDGS